MDDNVYRYNLLLMLVERVDADIKDGKLHIINTKEINDSFIKDNLTLTVKKFENIKLTYVGFIVKLYYYLKELNKIISVDNITIEIINNDVNFNINLLLGELNE